MKETQAQKASFSIPSILAVLAALFSFATGAFWGFVLAVVAMVLGVIGVLLSFSRSVRGGMLSAFALGAGGIGFVAAAIKAVMWLL